MRDPGTQLGACNGARAQRFASDGTTVHLRTARRYVSAEGSRWLVLMIVPASNFVRDKRGFLRRQDANFSDTGRARTSPTILIDTLLWTGIWSTSCRIASPPLLTAVGDERLKMERNV